MFNDANPAGHRSPNHGHAKGNDDDHHDKQIPYRDTIETVLIMLTSTAVD